MAAAAETRAVAGPAQAAHQRNFALAAAVGEMERQLDMLRATLPEPVRRTIECHLRRETMNDYFFVVVGLFFAGFVLVGSGILEQCARVTVYYEI